MLEPEYQQQSGKAVSAFIGVCFYVGRIIGDSSRLMANGRSLEFMDMLANLGEAIVGLLAYNYMVKIHKEELIS